MRLEDPAVLEKYASLIVKVGLNLHAGQHLMINAPLETRALVEAVAAQAYQSGCRLVEMLWDNDQLNLLRYQYAPRDSFNEYPVWRVKAAEEIIRRGDAYLRVHAQNPDLLKEQDPALIATAMQTGMKHMQELQELITQNHSNWLVVSLPVESWAVKVFPELAPAEAVARLSEEIVRLVRLDQPDPAAAWRTHLQQLKARCQFMNARRYLSLHFSGPGTDLTVGLPSGHLWEGGTLTTGSGIEFVPNIPTEEIFTLPHRERVNGRVQATMPLSYSGQLIEDFGMSFENGQVTNCHARRGEELLRKLLAMDEGARRLGEVALVPASSPVGASGRLFYNTLFDENAASHLAVGRAYLTSLRDGEKMGNEAFSAAGGNLSMTHTDFMIGSAAIDVDGILPTGATEPLMRQGEWCFEV